MPTPEFRTDQQIHASGGVPITVKLIPEAVSLRRYPPSRFVVDLADMMERETLGDRTAALACALSCAMDQLAEGDLAQAVRFLAAATLIARRVDAERSEHGLRA